jgi:hypothetical protein
MASLGKRNARDPYFKKQEPSLCADVWMVSEIFLLGIGVDSAIFFFWSGQHVVNDTCLSPEHPPPPVTGTLIVGQQEVVVA